jgi:hypothetical protein
LLVDDGEDVAGADGVAGRDADLGDRACHARLGAQVRR